MGLSLLCNPAMFGTVPLEVCAHCYEDEFATLAEPYPSPEEEQWYVRDCVVPTTCSRCACAMYRFSARWPFYDEEVVKTVYISASTLAHTRSLAGKCYAANAWGTKPANAELQLNNLQAAEPGAVRKNAALTIGTWAVRDELSLKRRGFCGSCGLGSIQGTSWKRWREPEVKQAGGDEEPAPGEAILAASEDGAGDAARPDPDAKIAVRSPPGLTFGADEAVASEVVDAQQRAFAEGGTLTGSTAHVKTTTADTEGQAADDEADIGVRTAHGRFPHMGDNRVFLFNGDPRNLEAAQALRDNGVGNFDPSIREHKSMERALAGLEERLFTDNAMRSSLCRYENVCRTAMPKKLSEEQKMQWHLDAMNQAEGGRGLFLDRPSFSKFIAAFPKSEVSAKNKPRPIANHKEVRLTALAKIAWIFEDVMFHGLEQMSIKHRTKSHVLSDVAKNLSEMQRGKWCENDLTAFEFGISKQLKAAECRILRHIADFVGLEESGSLLFNRVLCDRTESVVWSMTYKDEAGERRTFKLSLPRAMRESGDRLTSSGNFFQNLLAWLSFLVAPEHMDKAIQSLIKTRGKSLFYISARDGEKYLARLVFEGDDTVGRVEEAVWLPAYEGGPSLIDDFFRRWGWKPKLLWKSETGHDYARVVGYDILLHNNAAVYQGDELVACPEMKRLLNTKQWTTTAVTPEQRKTCTRIFAATLGREFARCEPFWAFCKGVYDANQGGAAVTDEMVREQFLALYGELPTHGSRTLNDMPFPDFEGVKPDEWQALARVTCGEFTDAEWAAASAVPDVNVHGLDLRTHYPASWIG